MANQRLFANQEDVLVQGGSGNDTIGVYTGRYSSTTIQGQAGKDWIYFGNTETAVTITVSGVAAKTAGNSTQIIRNGSNFSAGSFIATDTGATVITAGNLSTGLIFTALSQSGAETIQKSLIGGNKGNDTISFGPQVGLFSANTVRGGQGDDLIGTFGSSHATSNMSIQTGLEGSEIQGGNGNDTINFDLSGTLTGSGFTIGGNSGEDSIMFSAATIVAKAGGIKGGKGNDTISFLNGKSALNFTVNGGAGNDVLNVSVSGKFEKGLIASDKDNTVEGNDTINISGSAMSGSTIIGGGGNDSIVFTAMDADVSGLVQGGKGNDFIQIGTGVANFKDTTFKGGQGNDSISFINGEAGEGTFLNSGYIFAGAGDDTINLLATLATTAGIVATTIEGGAGADKLSISGVNKAGSATFLYSALSESTSASMDTIIFAKSASLGSAAAIGSAAINFKLTETVTLANGSGDATTGVTAQSGLVVFDNNLVDQDLGVRVTELDAAFTTTGTVAVFTVDGTNQFVFVQGGATDGVVKLGVDSALMSAGQFGRTGTIHASGTTFGF